MQNKKFSEFKIGDFAQLEHVITAEDIAKFVELTGDDNLLHVDKSFAKKTAFKDIVAHGMLGASFLSTLIGKKLPGNGALWISQNFEFLLPMRINDTLTIHAHVIDKHDSQQVLVLAAEITNQHKQIVVKGTGKIKCIELEKDEEEVTEIKDEKVVIIIGASRGIGAATAEHLAKKGYRVVINFSQDRAGAEEVLANIRVNGGEGLLCQADVRDPVAVNGMITKTLAHFGTISGLIYGATSKIIASDFHKLDWTDIQTHFDTQLRGAFHCAQSVLKEFINKKRGSIVFIGSLTADATPLLKTTGYTTAKAALHSLAKCLALEYGPLGIRFNVVAPGMTETGLISDIPDKTRLLTKMQIPLRKLAKPQDIVGAIEFLLSSEASHITGETLRIYGGQLMV